MIWLFWPELGGGIWISLGRFGFDIWGVTFLVLLWLLFVEIGILFMLTGCDFEEEEELAVFDFG